MSQDLDPVTWITAGAVGEPGRRTFFVQAASAERTVTLLVEKEQVAALARHIDALLARLGQTHPLGAGETEPERGIIEPAEPEFRVGRMALGYDADRDLVLLQCQEFVPGGDAGDEDDDDDDMDDLAELVDDDVPTARFWATRAQMRAMARHASQTVATGRPSCRLCGRPMDAGGHTCPATNGHLKA